MMTVLGYGLLTVCTLCFLGLLGGLPMHRDGWRAGLRQYGTILLVLLLAIGIGVYSLFLT